MLLENSELLKFLSVSTDNAIREESKILMNQYPNDLSQEFTFQITSFRSTLRNKIYLCKDIKQLATLLICDYSSLITTFPDVYSAFIIFLTLPVTTATSERSFSKLKIIKNYLRSALSQERLTGLALLSIEAERARKLNNDTLIDIFAEEKARKKKFD